MNGIHAAVQGRLPKDAEPLRYTGQGLAFVSFSLAVNDAKRTEDAPAEWVRVTVWGDQAEQLADRLKRGDECYVEGRLRLAQWEDGDGRQRAGLAVSAWKVEPLGQIGRRAPRQSRPAGWRQAGGGAGRADSESAQLSVWRR